MKRLFYITAVLGMIAGPTFAQTDAISKYFSEYESDEDATMIELSGKAFDLLEDINAEGEDEKRVKDLASQITGLRMIISTENPNGKADAINSRKKIDSVFEELMVVREKEGVFYVMIDERDGIVYEVLALAGDNERFLIADLKGQIRLQDVAELTGELSKVNSEFMGSGAVKPGDVAVYPNPADRSQELTIELPEEFDGAQVLIMDASGKKVHEFVSRGKTQKLSAQKLGTGVFVMRATKGAFDVTKKFIVR